MYKVLVADDEEWIRKGIHAVIQALGYDFEVRDAENGEEAVRVLCDYMPDIVFLDIRMPFLDGIEVLTRANKQKTKARFIIISGYSEFEYAQKALNQGASGYLLKPVEVEKLEEMLGRVIHELDEERQAGKIHIQKKELERSNNLLTVEKLVNRLIHTPEKIVDMGSGEIASTLDFTKAKFYTLGVFHINNLDYRLFDKDFKGLDGLKRMLKELLQDDPARSEIMLFDNHKNVFETLVLMSGCAEGALREKTESFMKESFSRVREEFGIHMTAAISEVTETLDSRLYEKLRMCLDLRFLCGNDRIYSFEDMNRCNTKDMPYEELKLLMKHMQKSDYVNVKEVLKSLFICRSINEDKYCYSIRPVYKEVISVLTKTCAQQNIDIHQYLSESDITGEILDYFDNGVEVVRYLYTTIMNTLKIESGEVSKCSNIIEMVIAYIDDNYDSALSVKDIAYKFAINPSYFSTLFKKATGKNFIEYVNNKKIEAACRMIAASNISITEIAENLGFTDTQYFFKLFKKLKGVTPLEFKRKCMKRGVDI